jgi:hypothetical protein
VISSEVGSVEMRCSNASGDLQVRFRNGQSGNTSVLRVGSDGHDVAQNLSANATAVTSAAGTGEQYHRFTVVRYDDSGGFVRRKITRVEVFGNGGASGCSVHGVITSAANEYEEQF